MPRILDSSDLRLNRFIMTINWSYASLNSYKRQKFLQKYKKIKIIFFGKFTFVS